METEALVEHPTSHFQVYVISFQVNVTTATAGSHRTHYARERPGTGMPNFEDVILGNI